MTWVEINISSNFTNTGVNNISFSICHASMKKKVCFCQCTWKWLQIKLLPYITAWRWIAHANHFQAIQSVHMKSTIYLWSIYLLQMIKIWLPFSYFSAPSITCRVSSETLINYDNSSHCLANVSNKEEVS